MAQHGGGAAGLIAIESKCTEYLTPQFPKFSVRYEPGSPTNAQTSRYGACVKNVVWDKHAHSGSDAWDAAALIDI
jgi:hypothetical protein